MLPDVGSRIVFEYGHTDMIKNMNEIVDLLETVIHMVKEDSINVFGSCVSRDIFNIPSARTNIKVCGFVQRQNQFLIMQKSVVPEVTDKDVGKYRLNFDMKSKRYEELGHDFNIRMLKASLNVNIQELLLSNKGNWIIIDSWYIQTGTLIKIVNTHTGQSQLLQGGYTKLAADFIKSKKMKNIVVKKYDACINIPYYLEQLQNFLELNWGNNIIVLNSPPGQFRDLGNFEIQPEESSENHIHGLKMCELLVNRLKCYCIDLPQPAISRDNNGVHYTKIYFEYLREMVDSIILRESEDDRSKIKSHYLKRFDEYFDYKKIDEYAAIRFVLKSIKKNDEAVCPIVHKIVNQLIAQSSPAGYYLKAQLLYSSYGIVKNDDDIIKYIMIAYNMGYCASELYDFLWKVNNPAYYEEMISIVVKSADDGDPQALAQLAKAYRYGRGVEQDSQRALELYRKANVKNAFSCEIFDLLWQENNSENYNEMIDVLKIPRIKGDKEAIARLAKAYHYGRGVEQDDQKTLSLLRRINKNHEWSNQLFDLLWKMNNSDYDKEMIDVIEKSASNGNQGAILRLGKAYYYGRGVKTDRRKAKKLFQQANQHNNSTKRPLKIFKFLKKRFI